jgi:hypothetical protein
MQAWGDECLLRTNAPISHRAKASAQRNDEVSNRQSWNDEKTQPMTKVDKGSKAFRSTPAMNHVAPPDFERVALPGLSRESTKVSASQSWYF